MKNETNTQHTQGEWVIVNSEKSITVTTRAFGAICEIPHGGKAIEEHKANAQLIARAPELLKESEQLKSKYNQDVTAYIKAGAKAEASKVELLDRLKMSNMAFKSLLEEEQGTVGNGEYFQKMKENRIRIFMDMIRNNNEAISKAEGKTLVGS